MQRDRVIPRGWLGKAAAALLAWAGMAGVLAGPLPALAPLAITATAPGAPVAVTSAPAGATAVPDTIAQRAIACTACHGKEGRATRDGYFPRIAGKPAGYLYNQLRNFRDGRRHTPMMAYMVTQLSDAYLHELADYFANQHPPYPPQPPGSASASELARGQQLALHGDAARKVPACIACHGERLTGVAPAVPGLVGLPRDYLNAQFGAWKNGSRRAATPDCMAQIASRLSLEDISAAASWLAVQPVPDDPAPQAAARQAPPMVCGSIEETRR